VPRPESRSEFMHTLVLQTIEQAFVRRVVSAITVVLIDAGISVISGIGAKKLETYGAALLRAIKEVWRPIRVIASAVKAEWRC